MSVVYGTLQAQPETDEMLASPTQPAPAPVKIMMNKPKLDLQEKLSDSIRWAIPPVLGIVAFIALWALIAQSTAIPAHAGSQGRLICRMDSR